MKDRKLPKSLHTVTVLVKVAKDQRKTHQVSADAALDMAISILDLRDLPDVYGLIDAAKKQLCAEAVSTWDATARNPYSPQYRGSDFS